VAGGLDVPSTLGVVFGEFSSKNTGFCAFLLQKTNCCQKLGQGALIDPWGTEDVKCMGTGGVLHQLAPCK